MMSIKDYANNPLPGRILSVYGLRGTGKTVAILKSLRLLTNNLEDVAYVILDSRIQISCLELSKYLGDRLYNKKIVVIDEVTYIDNLVSHGGLVVSNS